ncbi:MAG: uracil-DNA glycosylase [Candidatus Buchananbacteria bacterium]|nr:uracil-DNA glycosylase [Candidatus Buchananbacteria bacterium]
MSEKLDKIKNNILKNKNLPLYQGKNKLVFGEGKSDADIIFIGEAPGAEEEKQNKPFCGRAGQILNKLFNSINLSREDVYITNIVKFRPPNNRKPKQSEIEAYASYLDKQIQIINPDIIVCLGNTACQYIFNKYNLSDKLSGISKIHGKIFKADDLKIIPFYHPAVAVYNFIELKKLKKDFKILKKTKA